MIQFLAMIKAGCRRLFPRHLLHRITTLVILTFVVWFPQAIYTQQVIAESSSRPNIVLIMADDQGWGDVGYYGKSPVQTPVLDEMAATALRFDRFYAAAPVCSPTRGSVLTGRHPNRFGCFRWGYTLRPQEYTIAEALKTAGYTTGHFGKWHLGSVRAQSPVCPGNSGFDEWLSSPNFFENSPLLSHRGKVVETEGESSMVTADAALDFIRKSSADEKPFLAVVWFGSPHGPHIAIDELRELYKDHPKAKQHFLGEVTGIDRAVGHIREQLRELGIAKNTLLWYTSDNGALPVGSTGGLSGKKGNLYEGGIRVPAIIEWPARIKSHRITNMNCNTVDIYPTLLDIAGVEMENQPVLDGISLVPLIDGKMEARNKPMGFWDYPSPGKPMRSRQMLETLAKEQSKGGTPSTTIPDADAHKIGKQFTKKDLIGHSALINGDMKLHRIVQKNGNTTFKLFDLKNDPQEMKDLSESQTEQLKKLQAQLAQWQQSVLDSLNGKDYATD